MDFENWWNSESADGFRAKNEAVDGESFRPVWDAAIRSALAASHQAQAPAAPSTHAGLLAAAAHIQAKAQAHLDERGSYDPDTDAVEMSESNQEHFNTLDELADEIRMMADKAAPASCDRPPAGWTCSRASGHDGPCAAAPAAPVGWTNDQMIRFASQILRHGATSDSIEQRLGRFRGDEEFRGLDTPKAAFAVTAAAKESP